jgi:hypothetical protein
MIARGDIRTYFQESAVPELNILYKVHQNLNGHKFAEAKYLWLKDLPEFRTGDKMNVFGSEDKYFVSRLESVLTTTYTSSCSNKEECPQPLKIRTCRIVTFRLVYTSLVVYNNHLKNIVTVSRQQLCLHFILCKYQSY